MNDNNILAVVLAGGKSKRFGEDKNQAKLGGITLLEHVLKKVTSKFNETLIISNQNLNIKKINSVNIVPDCIQGNLGPLVGVLTAMKWIKKNNEKYQWVATFPCDTPFFDITIIEEYKSKINLNESLLYFVKSNEKRHNIFGLWSVKLIDTLEKDLVDNNYRKVEKWADKIGVKIINIKNDKFDNFFNINTKADLEDANKLLKEYKND